MAGGGYAFASRDGTDLETLQNFGMVRLAFDFQAKYPVFASIDLNTFRIQRKQGRLDDHHFGEGAGVSIGMRTKSYSFWTQAAMGRLRVLEKPESAEVDKGRRHPYRSYAFAASYPVFKRDYGSIDLQLIEKIVTPERTWKRNYDYSDVRMTSIVLAFTLADL